MKLNVLYTSDNNYAPWLCISAASLLKNNTEAEEITIYAVKDDWDEHYVTCLEQQVADYGESRHLRLIDGKEWEARLDELGMCPYRGGHAPNLRLFFTEFIAPDVDRLLYLDCDTIVCGDLSELFATDMGDTPMAVVLDSLTTHYRKYIGLTPKDTYFNSGVILFDIDNWKKVGATDKLMELLNGQSHKNFINPDQDALNIALRDQVTVLHPKYNFQTTHEVYSNKNFFANYGGVDYYTCEELDDARENPVILHAYRFLGQFPWHKNAIHPWRPIFLEYAEGSRCADFRPKENEGIIFAVERVMYRVLPEGIFLYIFRIWQNYHMKKHFRSVK